jgi:hypothetical protein
VIYLSFILALGTAPAAPPSLASRARKHLGIESDKWTQVSQSDSFVDFVEMKDVTRHDDKVEAWVLTVVPTKGRIQGKSYGSAFTLEGYDCRERRVKTIESIYYSGYFKDGKVVADFRPEEPEWERVVPGSVAAARLAHLCDQPSAPEAKTPNLPVLATDELWMLRAKRAVDSFDNLTLQLDSTEPSVAANAKCNALLEVSYSGHMDPELMNVLQKRSSDGDGYHVMMNGGDAGVLDLVYYYPKSSIIPVSRVDALPKGWYLTFLDPPTFVVSTPRRDDFSCDFVFSSGDPFTSFALARKAEIDASGRKK